MSDPSCKHLTILIAIALCNIAILVYFNDPATTTNIQHSPNNTFNVSKTNPNNNDNKSIILLKKTLQQTLNIISNISNARNKPYPLFTGKLRSDHYDPLTSKHQPVNIIYNQTNRLKIRIAIPTGINSHDNNLRQMQRQSWIKYLNPSNNLWNNTHSLCDISYNYFAGISNNTFENETIDKENKKYNDIIRLNVTDTWDNLQIKTIDMLLTEHLISETDSFDLLLKTDTDSYVNVPNLCHFMVKLMNINNLNGRTDGLYLGVLRNGEILTQGRYVNIPWRERVGHTEYSKFMCGFGYFISFKTTEIIYNSLHITKNDIQFNRLEDTYLGHFLISFNVKFVDLQHVIKPNSHPNVFALNNYIIDHRYNDETYDAASPSKLMIEKYTLHCTLHQLYIINKTNETYGYNPKML